MTKEERRAKFLRHNKSAKVNRPGSHKKLVCLKGILHHPSDPVLTP